MKPRTLIAAAFVVSLLASIPAADALYIRTPLHLQASQPHAEVGDTIDFNVTPTDDEGRDAWKGRAVKVVWSYDANEGREWAEDENPEPAWVKGTILDALVLDDVATGAFSWTIPEDVRDRNVAIALESGDELLAIIHVAIGEVEPLMTIAMTGPGGEVDNEDLATEDEDTGAPDAESHAPAETARTVPVVGALGLVGSVVVLALLSRRR